MSVQAHVQYSEILIPSWQVINDEFSHTQAIRPTNRACKERDLCLLVEMHERTLMFSTVPSHQLWAVYETSRPWSAHGNKAHHSQPFRRSCNLRQVHTNLRHVAWNTRDCHHASLPWDQGKVYRCHISWRQCNYQVRAWLILTKFIEQESGSGTLTPPETETNAQW